MVQMDEFVEFTEDIDGADGREFSLSDGRVEVNSVLLAFSAVSICVKREKGRKVRWRTLEARKADGLSKSKFLAGSSHIVRPIRPTTAGAAVGVGGSGAGGINWTEVLKLSPDEQHFLDGFLAKKYALGEQVTDVARVPVYGEIPSMLLFDLGRKHFTHAAAVKAGIQSARRKLQRIAVVAGTSGCGKTRSLYDLFSEEDGFYLVMTTALSGGSDDMGQMVLELEKFMLWGDKTGGNEAVVRVFTMLLLACRTIIYQYCKQRGADSRQWLLLQAAGRGMSSHVSGVFDVFLSFFERAIQSLPGSREGIVAQKDDIQRAVGMLLKHVPTVALDEAQVAMDLSKQWFWSKSRQCWLPLANRLVECLQVGLGSIHTVLVTGTGSILEFKSDLLGGSGYKMIASPELFKGFSAWDRPEDMVEFAGTVLCLSKDDLILLESKTWGVFPQFRGRFRPFCDVLQAMLAKKMTLKQASDYVIQAQTTLAGQPEFPKTFYSRVGNIRNMAPVNGIVLITELEKAVVRYFGSGRGWCIDGPKDACVAAVEAGIARMVTDGYAAEIEEYLIVLAARNFFEDEYEKQMGKEKLDWLPKQLFKWMCEVPYASPQGFCYQNYVASAFGAMWKKKGGKMADMPLFEHLLKDANCPSKFRKLAHLPGKLREGLMEVLVYDYRYTLGNFLSDLKQDRQLCTHFVCENTDVARGIGFELENGTEYLMNCFEQHKLQQDPLSDSEMTNAVQKPGITDPTMRSMCSDLELRILYICPQRRGRWPAASWKGLVGTIIVDKENAHHVFGEETAQFLQVLKDHKGGLECSYDRCQEGQKKKKRQKLSLAI